MVVGGWSSADGRRRMVVGLARRSPCTNGRVAARRRRPCAPFSVRLAATSFVDRVGSSTFPRRELRRLDRRSLLALVVVLVRLRASRRAARRRPRFSRGLAERAKSHDVRSVGCSRRVALDGDADASRASGCADGGWTRAAYAALGSRPRGGRSADPRASVTALRPVRPEPRRPRTTPGTTRAAREFAALRSTRYARKADALTDTLEDDRDRTSRRSPPRTRVWTGPRPPHSETWRAARDVAFHPSRVVSRAREKFPWNQNSSFSKQADDDDSSSTENELGITSARSVRSRAASAAQTLLSRTP